MKELKGHGSIQCSDTCTLSPTCSSALARCTNLRTLLLNLKMNRRALPRIEYEAQVDATIELMLSAVEGALQPEEPV